MDLKGVLAGLVLVFFLSSVNGLQGTLENKSFFSNTLDKDVAIQLYLPPNYSASRSKGYPVVVFMHGTELNFEDYPNLPEVVDSLIVSGEIEEIILAKTDGNWEAPTPASIWDCPLMPSWYVNSPAGDFEDYIAKDVPNWLKTYNIDENRLVLSGHSSGGFGAFWIGFRHTDVFSSIMAFSGVVLVDQLGADVLGFFEGSDALGIVSLADYYSGDYEAPAPSTKQSPALGYYSDVQWKMNYAFSPKAKTFSSEFDRNDVHNIFVGSPDPESVENIAVDSDTSDIYASFNIDKLVRDRKKQVEKLEYLYFDVGKFDDFLLQDDAARLNSVLEDLDLDLEYYYEEFDTGIGCVQCTPGETCGAGDYPCGKHFADFDGEQHGACLSRYFGGGLPYTGAIGSRFENGLVNLNAAWARNDNNGKSSDNSSSSSASYLASSVLTLVLLLLACF